MDDVTCAQRWCKTHRKADLQAAAPAQATPTWWQQLTAGSSSSVSVPCCSMELVHLDLLALSVFACQLAMPLYISSEA